MRRATLTPLALIVASMALSACGDTVPQATPSATATTVAGPVEATEPRAQLAGRAAAAKDLKQVATYTFTSPKRPVRRVTITRAVDRTWRIDLPGGAYSGQVDIALVWTAGALHQCALPAGNHPFAGCVRLPGPLPTKADVKLEHLVTDWLGVLTDRRAALAVAEVDTLPGAAGRCYSVESSAASLKLPMDAGIYCFEADGTLTAARVGFGTLMLSGPPAPGPQTVQMPGPIVPGQPLPINAPPSPSPSVSPSGTPSPTPKASPKA
ncbi:hypothetical protein QEZ54_25290 [Catellatospora sp. KI3]|uniref:hypothetical protein n=1 Tax=Catellatospora sp. KI3 TaxID=3041620 RepID=UPI002482B28A|nr:hypothetical protein [Catellatospora sp. KI3]MDI1464290.1 hypothetical protein [Catellatospora sp. KI3]